MIKIRDYIAPQGNNLRGDVWILAGPWELISSNCSINFPDTMGTNVIIKVADFSYLTHSGSIAFTLNLRNDKVCDISLAGQVDGKPVQEGGTNIPYHTEGSKLVIDWSKFPLSIFRYHGKDETEIDIGNVPVLNNISFWIGR